MSQVTRQSSQLVACHCEENSGQRGNPDLTLPFVPEWADPVWHLFVIRYPNRGNLQKKLTEAGVGTLIHYPVSPHLQGAYVEMGLGEGAFPIAEQMAGEVLSFPMGPQMTGDQPEQVMNAMKGALDA